MQTVKAGEPEAIGMGMLGIDCQHGRRKAAELEQIRAFLEASEEIRFEGRNRKEMYYWVKQTLIEQQYQVRGKTEKGLLRSYKAKMTGLSRAQVTRLIGQYVDTGEVEEREYRRRRFPSLYTRRDIELLAEVDEAHETLSGPATQKILYREYHEYGVANMSGWPASRWRIFTTCVRVGRIANARIAISRRGQQM
jgi:transposase